MATTQPIYSLKDFLEVLQQGHTYPFYGVLLYTPMNGLDARLHQYVMSRWQFLNRLTGNSCLLFAVEDIERGQDIKEFKPEEIYDIARTLGTSGTSVKDIPCIVFFTEPKTQSETLVLKLGEFLPASNDLTDDNLTDFFRSLEAILDSCSTRASNMRLQCLKEGLNREWPKESTWFKRVSELGGWVVKSTVGAASIASAISAIIAALTPLFH